MELIREGSGPALFLFAHGAGAPMDSPFMTDMAGRIAAAGIEVVRFEFPYMAARRKGTRRPPDREPVLLHTWRARIATLRDGRPVVIGGKSMGGRMATMIADETEVAGVVCFGYPFHPPGRPGTARVAHLRDIRTPVLVLQGTRDSLGSREDVAAYALSPALRLHWLEDGDHSLEPRVRSGRTREQNVGEAAGEAAQFILKLATG